MARGKILISRRIKLGALGELNLNYNANFSLSN